MSNLSNIWAASTPSIIVFLVYIIYYAYFLQRLRRHIVGTYCFCINSIDLKTLIEPEMSFVLIKSLVVIIKGSFHSPAFSQIYRSIDQLHEHKNIWAFFAKYFRFVCKYLQFICKISPVCLQNISTLFAKYFQFFAKYFQFI